MSDGHRTSTIPRPAGARDPSRPNRRVASTRPDDTRLIQRRRSRGVLGLGALLITAAIAAALFVLPLRAWLNQRDQLAASRADLALLEAANDRLEQENGQLLTPEGITEAARADLGYQTATELIEGALPPPQVPYVLPNGWPYSFVSQVLEVRTIAAYNAGVAATDPAGAAVTGPTTTFPSYSAG